MIKISFKRYEASLTILARKCKMKIYYVKGRSDSINRFLMRAHAFPMHIFAS